MTEQEKTLAGFILNRRYFLKLYNKPKSKWRELIANEYAKCGMNKSYPENCFCKVWSELEMMELI